MAKVARNSQRGGSKPGERRGGRQPGTPNRVTRDVRQAIQVAFDRLGGVDYIERLGRTDPKTFVPLLSKIVPQKIEADVTHHGAGQLPDVELVHRLQVALDKLRSNVIDVTPIAQTAEDNQ